MFEFKSLAGEHTAQNTEETPPTKNVLDFRFNVCDDLKKSKDSSDAEQCPSGTRACLVKTNKKDGEKDRVIAVIPVVRADSPKTLGYSKLDSPQGVSIQLYGPSYPPDGTPSVQQSLNLKLLCVESSEESEPEFVQYVDGVVTIEWKHHAGCPNDGTGKDKDDDKDDEHLEESHGSGIGWFFLLLLISFLAYFVLGAYYNYNNFGATGWDLIPHRDFWRDVPYLIRDFGDHLCNTLRPGRQQSRRGYFAV